MNRNLVRAAVGLYLALGIALEHNLSVWERGHCPEPHLTDTQAVIMAAVLPVIAPLFLTGAVVGKAIGLPTGPKKCNRVPPDESPLT